MLNLKKNWEVKMIPAKLLIKVILITAITSVSPIIYAIYLIKKEIIGIIGFTLLWSIATGIILLLLQYYVKPKFKAYLESLPSHETGI